MKIQLNLIKDPLEQRSMIEKIDGQDFESCKEIYDYLQFLHSIISNQQTALNSAVYQLRDYITIEL